MYIYASGPLKTYIPLLEVACILTGLIEVLASMLVDICLSLFLLSSPVLGAFVDAEGKPDWTLLNRTVQGRLHPAVPLSYPCFSPYGNTSDPVDPSKCSKLRSSYYSPEYRVNTYSAAMQVRVLSLRILYANSTSFAGSRNGRRVKQRAISVCWIPTILRVLQLLRVSNVAMEACLLTT
jgi:hypothetical protein